MSKKKKWNDRETPSLKHIIGDLDDNRQLNIILSGHLVIESILVQLIDAYVKFPDQFDAFRLSFPQKIELCLALGVFPESMAEFLIKFNIIRNKFAHRLGYKINFEKAFTLVNQAVEAGIDFSDDTIYRDKQKSEEIYGIVGILSEIRANTSQELDWILYDKGKDLLFV